MININNIFHILYIHIFQEKEKKEKINYCKLENCEILSMTCTSGQSVHCTVYTIVLCIRVADPDLRF